MTAVETQRRGEEEKSVLPHICGNVEAAAFTVWTRCVSWCKRVQVGTHSDKKDRASSFLFRPRLTNLSLADFYCTSASIATTYHFL